MKIIIYYPNRTETLESSSLEIDDNYDHNLRISDYYNSESHVRDFPLYDAIKVEVVL